MPKRGARPWGRERVARALTREESRERIQSDGWGLAVSEDPDKGCLGIAAFCMVSVVKYL